MPPSSPSTLRATLSGDDASLAAPTRSPTAVGRSFGRTALDACSRPTQRVYPKTAGGASASPPPHMSVVVAGARGPENTHAYDSTDVRTEFARLHAASHAASCGHAPPRLAMSPSIRPSPRIKPYHPRQAKSSASCLSCDLSPAARLWAVNVHAGVQRCLHRTTLAPANVAGHLVSLRAWPWRKLARPSEARRITARWFCWEGPADDGHGECGCCSHVCAPMGRDVSADPGARPAQPPSRTGRGE
jgi:hypothetical protein